jgi:hypothetical protein
VCTKNNRGNDAIFEQLVYGVRIQSMRSLASLSIIAMTGALISAFVLVHPASAQNAQPRVGKKALEKAIWNTAPREFQIIDDSPIIRDFREAPQNPGSIAIPPGPQAGPGGGHGQGGMPPLGGGPGDSIPGGGLHIPGDANTPGYRTTPSSIPSLGTLPQNYRGSNIPARGMGPRGALPNGSSNNQLYGKMLPPKPAAIANAAGPGKGLSANPNGGPGGPGGAQGSSANRAVPTVSSYASYGSAPAAPDYGGNGNRTETFVRGSLLRK